jgi:sRNA-binding carbon storage regulator CsrA
MSSGLVLSRQPGERVLIRCPDGTVLAVTVVEASHGRLRLAFAAPPDCVIVREELIPEEERPQWLSRT